MPARGAQPSLALPLGGSAVLHLLVLSLVFVFRPPPPRALPPIYRVNIVAAPVGEVAAGVVQPAPAKPPPAPATPPRTRAKSTPKPMPSPAKTVVKPAPVQATPVPPVETKQAPPQTKATPTAGSETGGRGADVVNVNTAGINFPFPTYLEGIVREIALRFHWAGRGDLRAEVVFLIHRDGSVSDFRFNSQSAVYSFNVEARGAVEAAGSARAFGSLPSAFPDDVLPVIFSFDPRLIRK